MNALHIKRIARFVAASLLLALGVTHGSQAQVPPFAPRDAVQGQSYSVAVGNDAGIHPADIAGASGLVFINCLELGLLCTDINSGVMDDLAALSFGRDFNIPHLPPIQFSVGADAQGVPGSAVALEASCTPSQANADVFETTLNGTNAQDLDGDGTACSTNTGFGLGLVESSDANADGLDALAQDPCQIVDFDCDGVPDQSIYFVMAANSPSLALFGASTADILVARSDGLPEVWANGVAELGLREGDAIDALCLEEDGNGIFGADDNLLFSLTPDSPSLSILNAGPGALLTAQPLQVVAAPSSLGLAATDDVDALACGALVVEQIDGIKSFFPVIGNHPPSP